MKFFGKIEVPEQLNEFVIPVLCKVLTHHYGRYSDWTFQKTTHFEPANTDGFYYTKDNVKYFRVKSGDNIIYKVESDLVFLTNEK